MLFTLCKGLAPFTPFITETIYQKLAPFIPKDLPKELQSSDMRSVHFLPFPTVRQELFDPVVERKVGRMQKVIELARVSRERRAIGLKTPLKTLIVIHHSQEYLDDVKSLQGYISEELNIRDLVLTSDEAKYGVQYSATADWPVLGKKLKKDMAKVKKALPLLQSEQVHAYVQQGTIEVDGIKLDAGDLVVKRGLSPAADGSSQYLETNTDNDVLIILDCELHADLADEGLAREIINRVQRLRKKAGLVATDDVRMEYKVLGDPETTGIEKVFQSQSSMLEKALRRPMEGEVVDQPEDGVIAEEMQEVQKATFRLRLLKL